MALTFNVLLRSAGISPFDVRLLRHETRRHGRTPYALWREDRAGFDDYQRVQKTSKRAYFASPYWASFVVASGGRTLFTGLSAVGQTSAIPPGWIDPISGRDTASLAEYNLYDLQPLEALSEYAGRLIVDWGRGAYAWRQRADLQDKPVLAIVERTVDPTFPGYTAFTAPLSDVESLPSDWRGALSAAQGVYLLTCPRTREQYVGSASGEAGFLGRWLCYARDTHGGNITLKSREPSDYQVTILQVAGSADTQDDVLAMETLWKRKLLSREMGLNRN